MEPETGAEAAAALDFLSESFDPLRALRTEGLQPPIAKVRPLDNLNKCRAILPPEVPESLANAPVKAPRSAESIAAQERAKSRTSLLAEKAAERARRYKILDVIADKLQHGPLSLLVDCYRRRGRVQVWTRHTRGPRGVLTGYLQALDKHMNLVLRDVDEEYTVRLRVPRLVRVRLRAGARQGAGDGVSTEGGVEQKEKASPGEFEMQLKLFPKLEHRRRHLQQIFLRGDSIIMVRKLT